VRHRLLIVEDEEWIRDGLAKQLGSELDVYPSGTAAEALQVATRVVPDLALVDIGLPDRSGIDVISELRAKVPACVPVLFTVFDDAATVLSALRAGARGYLLKNTPNESILPSLRDALAGGIPLSPAVARLVVDTMLTGEAQGKSDEVRLTARESELLTLLARGSTYAECAEVLGIGLGTVQSYIKNVYAKLEVSSKAEAAVEAMRRGLV
jgi:DNA-binding NarL/FixJ family response regulator